MTKERRLFHILIAYLIIFCGVSIYINGFNDFWKFNVGDFSVAFGTIFLAFYTYRLAYSEAEESRKERKRLRLDQQLRFFYSPFIGTMIEKRNKELKDVMTQPFIINHYVFLASEKLKEKLNEYYQSKNRGADEKILDMLDEIKNIAFADYSTLTEEYDELTK